MKKSRQLGLFVMIGILLISILSFLPKFIESEGSQESQLNLPIRSEEIKSIRAQKVVYQKESPPNIRFVDVNLSKNEVNKVTHWLNSLNPNDYMKVNRIDGSVNLGIVYRLNDNKEVRVQYNSEDIFVTSSGDSYSNTYKIEQLDMQKYFKELTKGYYYGNDKPTKQS